MKRLMRPAFPILLCSVLLGGCSGGVELPGTTQGSASTRITGTVTATADGAQFVTVRAGAAASLTAFLFGPAHAAVTGLTPVAGATVELVRLADGTVIGTAITGGAGTYTFPEAPVLGSSLEYAVRVHDDGQTVEMRALVSGAIVDISPASEVIAGAVIDGPWPVSNFEVQEAAALTGLLASMDVDVSGMDFTTAVTTIRNAAGDILPAMVAGFSTPGAVTSLRGNDYSVINYSAALRDPLVVAEEDAPGGVEIRSGQGSLIYGFSTNSDAPTIGFLAEGAFLHDFSAVGDPSNQDQDAFPFLSVLTDLLHVPNDRGQLLVADRLRPSVSVAGIGALAEGGDYLVYPLDGRVLVEDDPSIFLMGLRYAARWRAAGEAQPPVLDLSLLDAPGGTGTVYNHVRLQQTLDGPGAGTNGVRLTTEVGTVTFDSTPRLEDFNNQPTEYGSFVANTGSDTLSLDLSDYSISADNGSGIRNGLYFIPANSGHVQLRDALSGDMLGWGATSTDGLRDGEVIGGQMFSGGFDDPIVSAERSFSIAIRRASDMTAAALAGNYNLVEYGGYVANDVAAESPRGFIETGIRYGTVTLDGANGVSGGSLFRKLARIDVAAARGETGALPNASGESGAFATATAGEAGETFSLKVNGTEVAAFAPGPGETVTAEDIQAMIDIVAPTSLADDGILVEGSIIDGDLVFVRPTGEPFDIEVINDFTGTAPAAGGFLGEGFEGPVENGTTVTPNASGASGAFTTLTAGAEGEQFSLAVAGVTIFDFTSEGTGETVAAADLQAAIDAAGPALAAEDIEASGAVADGSLVFTKADGAPFVIQVTNTFGGFEGSSGGFANFQTGTTQVTGGTKAAAAVENASGTSGAFTPATAGGSGEEFTLQVGNVTVFTRTSANAGETVTADDVQGGVSGAASELNATGFTVRGTVAGGDLSFARVDGAEFPIQVTNTFNGLEGSSGGFANFQTGTTQVTGGTEAAAAAENASGTSGAFTPAAAGGSGEEFTLLVGNVTVFTRTSANAGETVTADDVQGGVSGAGNELNAAGFTVRGTVAGGDLAFARADGAKFDMQLINDFSETQGGFLGTDFHVGSRPIDNGSEAIEAVAAESPASGVFTDAIATAAGQTYSMTVDGIEAFTFTSTAAGETVTPTDIQAQLVGNGAVLSAAGIGFGGSAESGDLVFSRADGKDFNIVVVNGFTDASLGAGGFAGDDFAAGARNIDNGGEAVEAVAAESPASGAFDEAIATSSGQTYSMTVADVPVFTFTSQNAGDTVTAQDIQNGVIEARGALTAAEVEFTGSAVTGDLVFSRADGTDFQIVIDNGFSGDAVPGGGFAGGDFAAGSHDIDNGTERAANESAPSGEFEAGVAGGAGETWSMSVGEVDVVVTAAAEGDTVTAADVQAAIEGAATALSDAGFGFSGTAIAGDLRFIREDGAPFDITIASDFSGRVSAAGGFAGADFATGVRTIDNGSVAGAVPSLASSSGQEAVLAGSYSVSPEGVVTLTLDIGNETMTGEGAVTRAGDFVAVVTGSTGLDGARSGRSILFLVRQPD